MSTIHVLAVITTKPGQRAAVLRLFNANVPAVLAEDGCIAYEATIDAENAGAKQTAFGSDTFVVIEKWSSLEALGAHAIAYVCQGKGLSDLRPICARMPIRGSILGNGLRRRSNPRR